MVVKEVYFDRDQIVDQDKIPRADRRGVMLFMLNSDRDLDVISLSFLHMCFQFHLLIKNFEASSLFNAVCYHVIKVAILNQWIKHSRAGLLVLIITQMNLYVFLRLEYIVS